MRLLLIVLGLCLFLSAPVPAVPSATRPLVVILLPGTSLSDWRVAEAPTLHRLMATGAIAVMNTRTARLPNDHRRESPGSAVLTLGAGSRAAGGSEISTFYPSSAQPPSDRVAAGALYARRMGTMPPSGADVNIQWPRVLRANTHLGYDLLPGNLAEGLFRQGIPLAAGGGPMALALASNSAGVVGVTVKGSLFPRPLPPLLIWDAGTDVVEADSVIRDAMSEVQKNRGQLIVLSPFVNDQQYARGERLAPILVWGPSITPGLLYSSSTHRAGLITNTDFAPSVTAFLGAQRSSWWLPATPFGHPWSFLSKTAALASVTTLERDAYGQADGMRMLPFVAICLGLLLIADAFCTQKGLLAHWFQWLPGAVIFALIVSPSAEMAALCAGAFSVILWTLQTRLGVQRLTVLIAFLTVTVLVADMLSGNRLMQHSLLGYSAVEGARYYGIGNEAMGPLIGSTLLTAAFFWKSGKRHRILIVSLLFGLSLLLGLPSTGAKAGGLLVAVSSFGAFVWTALGRQWSVRTVFALAAMMLLLLALVSLSDWLHQSGSQTHIGGAVARIRTGGAGEGWDIIHRKLAVESRLLVRSAWAVPLWVSIGGLAILWKRRQADRAGQSKALLAGGIAAIAVCLAVNDAGVVAAALCGSVVLGGLKALGTREKPMSAAIGAA